MAPLMLPVTITKKVTHLCAIGWDLSIWRIKLYIVCVKSNDTDAFTIMLVKYEKLNGLTLLIAWSNEKWID